VERFDYENHKAYVRHVEPDYFTTAMTYVQVAVLEESAVGPSGDPWASGWGEVSIVEKVAGYKKVKFHTHENAGYGDVRLPEMQMHTTAFWVTIPDGVRDKVEGGPAAAVDGLRGMGVALEIVSTLALMCDPRDLGTTLGDVALDADAPRTVLPGPRYSPTLFLYEHVPGGTGLAERIWEQRGILFDRALRMIESCRCAHGCPACVGPGESSRKRVALQLLRTAARPGPG
jgi:DEAD/DEAH box helicase domain-containing protein